jgi:hypothetical protein
MPSDQGATQVLSAMAGNAALIWIREDGSEIRFPIIAPITTIGREPSNMIPLNDATVSRFHAKLVFQNGRYIVMDLGSANKTYVNGQEIKEAALTSGCDIRFAGARFKFQELQPSVPSYAPPAYAPSPPGYAPPPGFAHPAPGMPPQPQVAPHTPYPGGPAAPFLAKPKRKPKPLFILGGVFILLLIIVVIFSKMGSNSAPSSPPASESKTAPPPAATPAAAPAASPASTLPNEAPGTVPGAPVATPSATTATPPPSTAPASTTPGTTAPTTSASVPAAAPAAPKTPQTVPLMLGEASSLESSGKLREALNKYEQVLKMEPTNSMARAHMENLKRDIEQAIQLHFKNAKVAFDNLRYDEALGEWSLVLVLAEPTDARYADSQRGIQQVQARLKR